MNRYKTFELTFSGPEPEGSAEQPDVRAEFICGEEIWKVKGFYDGKGTYKVRFLPQKEGTYIWRVSGIVQGTGKEECRVSTESHGMVQVEETHFVYQNGTKYLPFGTIVYALMHQSEKLIRQTLDTLRSAPFNKIRLCVFPKHCAYNNNDPEF